MTKDTLRKVAELACIYYDDAGLDKLLPELVGILAMLDRVKSCHTDGIVLQPAVSGTSVTRTDMPAPSMPRAELLARAKKTEAGCIVAPRTREG